MVLRIGQFLGGRYEISGKIGTGGMADVYKALDTKLNRQVAVKVLKEEYSHDRNFVSKFKMEAQSAASLSNPNVVNIYDVGDEMGIYYIVMELIEGITLKKYIERRGKLATREAIEVAMQVAFGLEAAHAEGLVHRDIKPQNILITKDGKIKVTDFGIARTAATQTVSTSTMGSAYYISPEQARGGMCDKRSDIYSLGITMYEMVTGKVPFDGDNTVAVALLHIQGEMEPPSSVDPGVPHAFERIIQKCTQKKPEQRYSSAKALLSDLKKALADPNGDFVVIEGECGRVRTETARRENSKAVIRSEEDEKERKFEKLVTYIGIGVAAVILIILLLVGLNALGVLNFGGGSSEETVQEGYVKMVDVLGKTYDEANEILTDMGLFVKASYVATDEYPEGQVYRQSVSPNNIIEKGSFVSLTIAMSNANAIKVPDGLAGLDITTVRNMLSAAGFTNVSEECEVQSDEIIPQGMVITTKPEPGTSAPKNGLVIIVISSGTKGKTVPVPDLEGLTEEDAKSLLEQYKLKAGSITENESTVEAGRVISQTPAKDTTVTEGSTVSFVISKGKAEVTVPNLIGKTLDEAKKALKDAGLSLGDIDEETSSEEDKDKVISQEISSGKKAKKGTSINIALGIGPEPVTEETQPTPEKTEAPTEKTEPVTEETAAPTQSTSETTEG